MIALPEQGAVTPKQLVATLPQTGASLYSPSAAGGQVYVLRFGDAPAAALDWPAAAPAALLRIPSDGVSQPWRIVLDVAGRVVLCGSGR